ncbi:molybdopterin molybdotransferase MoeA [Lentzea flaviverrucosa]|uniref:Molybdopterin molybdenumtransferase n=1 Tax=Lentzea flaviverrucosa TaxID=200379 RepID=A0A1H9LN45_9PSEU|nr:gephyrin-like molybdotransferase Glp [Lentzea flaviverrucosa]RDI31252.1 molybdopterin molybdochelatase [Lentzea flaviverrucosa]SER12768.1 molybdopterin molybdotransferase [Lentzea flaviverrucosa]
MSPTTVAEHRKRVAELVGSMPVLQLPLEECLGLVLAADVIAPLDLPPFDNSAMDGYAVRAADLRRDETVRLVGAVDSPARDETVRLVVADDIPAGRTELNPLEPGTVQRIMTGAPLPPGADAVVQVEWTDGGTETVTINRAVEPGQNIRTGGDDVRKGDAVLAAGTVLRPSTLGLASALGLPELPVRRRPRVLVLSTGSELVEPGRPLELGQIYESNGMMLASSVRDAGCVAIQLRFVPDDVEAFHQALKPYLGSVDVIMTSGGVSAGAYEVVKDALADHDMQFIKVAMQPGGPQGSGRYEGVPVLSLPGNPVSAQVSFEVFVRPALLASMGHEQTERPTAQARITTGLTSPAGKTQFRRGLHDPSSGQVVTPVGGPGSHLLSALALSNCLIEVPEDVTELAAGAEVTVRYLQ